MSLQTGLPTRRKFLERSVLGAGSVLFLPGLLAGCTDHTIPNPEDTPSAPWPLTDGGINIDWNNTARLTVITGLKMVPEVGGILSALTGIFWPKNQTSPWDQVKAQTEALVNQAIADAVYTQVSEDLQGLNNNITLYQNELKNGTPEDIKTQYIVTKNLFFNARPHFQAENNELPLLGMFIQFTNMYLALLRDGVTFGKSWGRSDADHQQDILDLEQAITDANSYTSYVIELGERNLANTGRNDHLCEPFRTLNSYKRQMTLLAEDYQMTWNYYDTTLYPNGANVVLTREIYSDPYGTCDDSGPIVLPSPATQLPTNLTVWGYDRIDAVQLTYPAGSGPGGVTTTPRMGDQSGGSNQPPQGGSFTISPDNPILQGRVFFGSIVDAMQFRFYDGTETTRMGGTTGGSAALMSFNSEALSSIHINGVSNYYQSADCVVFGFKFWQSPTATLKAIQIMYVRSPKEHSMADFAKAFPNLALPAALITDELKAARAAYWADIEARAKAPK